MVFYHIKPSRYVTASPALVTQQAIQIIKKSHYFGLKNRKLSNNL